MDETIEIQRGWLEQLVVLKERIDVNKIPAAQLYPFTHLFGYIESAKYILERKP